MTSEEYYCIVHSYEVTELNYDETHSRFALEHRYVSHNGWYIHKNDPNGQGGEHDVPVLCFVGGTFLILLILFLGACLQSSHRFIKYISCFMFSYIVAFFGVFKILRNQVGPLFMMNIVFVILFTSSKMRFHMAAIVGIVGIVAFATATLVALPEIDETAEGIQQQLVNFIVIFGSGMNLGLRNDFLD